MLNVNTPKEGYNLIEYLVRKYGEGARENFGSPNSPLNQAATSLGFSFNTDRRIVNSFDAHRLVEFAKSRSLGNEMMEILFARYFVDANDISQRSKLIDYGEECGFSREEIQLFLEGDDRKTEVTKADRYVKESLRVQGVPYISVTSSADESAKPIILRGAPSEDHMNMLFNHFLK